ncbi:MAG: purine-nucleoside phosphorylase [Planctomycetales bacterium 71-10]|nr:MAG: purine-nucleoside phosphorylase [Planctomycetales bacterium 71-10]
MSPTHQGPDLYSRAEEAAEAIRRATGDPAPRIAVVLGSGLNGLVERFGDRRVVPYSQIPHFPTPTVAGHAGNVVIGSVDGAEAILLQGRFHYYEGHDLRTVTFPVRVLQRLGVQTLILTAATGGVRPELRPGNLVCLSDHLNLIGTNPLRGPNDPRFGERFPDMTEVYSKKLRNSAKEEARRLGVQLVSAVYACLPGPSYETPAEIRMLRALGADVVGMSTAPEAIVARQAGMDVLGLALVTNAAAGVLPAPIRHEDVLEAGLKATPMLGKLIRRVILRVAGVAPGNVGFSGEFPTYRPD